MRTIAVLLFVVNSRNPNEYAVNCVCVRRAAPVGPSQIRSAFNYAFIGRPIHSIHPLPQVSANANIHTTTLTCKLRLQSGTNSFRTLRRTATHALTHTLARTYAHTCAQTPHTHDRVKNVVCARVRMCCTPLNCRSMYTLLERLVIAVR